LPQSENELRLLLLLELSRAAAAKSLALERLSRSGVILAAYLAMVEKDLREGIIDRSLLRDKLHRRYRPRLQASKMNLPVQ